jgi:uncharacterized nucleotidyltransferase DUF6036
MPSAVVATLADLASVLEAVGVRWYVFGAQAAIHYGSPRVTADVDVTVELGSMAPAALVARLQDAGIESRIELDDAFISKTRVLPMVHGATGMGVDVVLAGPGPEETFLARARVVHVEGVAIRIAAPDDIVVMKILAGRPKDIEDVVGILRAAPEGLDESAIRSVLTELETMLGQSDLVPVFDAARARAPRR